MLRTRCQKAKLLLQLAQEEPCQGIGTMLLSPRSCCDSTALLLLPQLFNQFTNCQGIHGAATRRCCRSSQEYQGMTTKGYCSRKSLTETLLAGHRHLQLRINSFSPGANSSTRPRYFGVRCTCMQQVFAAEASHQHPKTECCSDGLVEISNKRSTR